MKETTLKIVAGLACTLLLAGGGWFVGVAEHRTRTDEDIETLQSNDNSQRSRLVGKFNEYDEAILQLKLKNAYDDGFKAGQEKERRECQGRSSGVMD